MTARTVPPPARAPRPRIEIRLASGTPPLIVTLIRRAMLCFEPSGQFYPPDKIIPPRGKKPPPGEAPAS
jgi:hypothetical protein